MHKTPKFEINFWKEIFISILKGDLWQKGHSFWLLIILLLQFSQNIFLHESQKFGFNTILLHEKQIKSIFEIIIKLINKLLFIFYIFIHKK